MKSRISHCIGVSGSVLLVASLVQQQVEELCSEVAVSAFTSSF